MGTMKAIAMAAEADHAAAVDFLCELGVLAECENHPGNYYDRSGDLEYAYRVANARITAGTITLGPRESRRTFTDRLKAAYDDHCCADGCWECERAFGP